MRSDISKFLFDGAVPMRSQKAESNQASCAPGA
jgi:hypothetical protein